MKFARTGTLILTAALSTFACSSRDASSTDSAAVIASDASTSTGDFPAVSGADPTANEISNYKLDMDKMRRYVAVIKGFSSISRADSAAASAMATDGNESTARMIAKLEENQVAKRVLGQAGLSAKEYVWITAAWIQAAMMLGVLESNAQAKLPEGQNPQNIEFFKANKDELERMMREAGMSQ